MATEPYLVIEMLPLAQARGLFAGSEYLGSHQGIDGAYTLTDSGRWVTPEDDHWTERRPELILCVNGYALDLDEEAEA